MEDNKSYKNRTTKFTRTKTEDISTMLYGKIPPQSRELEEAVLGAILIEKQAFSMAAKILDNECFYVEAHSTIWNAIAELFIKNNPIDLLTVTEQLINKGKLEEVGGAYYISELTNKVASAANVEYHSYIIFQKYMAREMIRISNDTIRDAYEDITDVFDLHAEATNKLNTIIDKIRKNSVRKLHGVAIETAIEMKHAQENPKELLGLATPLPLLNELTDGWQAPDLIIIAAGPGEGKTTFMIQCAEHTSMNGVPTALFELEMSIKQLCWKVFAPAIGSSVKDIRKGKLTEEQWDRLGEYIEKIKNNDNLYLSDQGGMDILDLKSIIRGLVIQEGVKIVVIDYLQLIKARKGGLKHFSREAEVSYVSKELKALAKELNIPIIALAQVGRIYGEKGRFYVLSDLRESGAIEQDADMVMFLWRPFYHGVKVATDTGIPYTFDDTEMIIAKSRLNEPGKILAKFDGKTSQFKDCNFSPYQEATPEEMKKIRPPKQEKLSFGSPHTFETPKEIDDDLPF